VFRREEETSCREDAFVGSPVPFCYSNFLKNLHVDENVNMRQGRRYARIGRERRFLLERFRSNCNVLVTRHITDRYISGTALRLQEQAEHGGTTTRKLTQKIPMRGSSAQQGPITNQYLGEDEFGVLAGIKLTPA
jgi:hypothetical protein